MRSYRKKNSAIRHEYYTLASKHSDLSKYMFNFTAGGKGRGVYTKLRLINEVKKYLVHLINVTKADIYYFATIEMGHSFTNPHIHIQLWSDDKKSVEVIYDKVIDKFSLNSARCALTEPPQQNHLNHYDYVIKDFSKDLTDDEVWKLETLKKRCRKHLGLKLRFYSRSKSKYTQKTYRFFYRFFKVLRANADKFIDWFYSLFFRKQRVFKTSTILLSLYRINRLSVLDSNFSDTFLVFYFKVLLYSPARSPPFSSVLY